MRNRIFIFTSFLLISISLNARLLTYSWLWGIENIGRQSYFLINLEPSVHYKNITLKLDIPIEINTNWQVDKNHWDNKEDIITKIDYLTYTNDVFFTKIQTLNNITFGNGELIYYYSNDLFTPLIIKKGFSSGITFNNFQLHAVIDDLNDFDLIFFELFFNKGPFKTGINMGYDHDIFDPYSEKPIDNNTSILELNYFINYDIIKSKCHIITLENDVIKNIKSYQFNNNYIIASGLKYHYDNNTYNNTNKKSSLFSSDLRLKVRYYQKGIPCKVYFDKFYEIQRGDLNHITDNEKIGVFTSWNFGFFNVINFVFSFEKVKSFNPSSIFRIETLDRFPSKINSSIEFYNKEIKFWYDIISEKEKHSVVLFKNAIPLSKHLSLHFDYIKTFRYEYTLRGLHQVVFYSKFVF